MATMVILPQSHLGEDDMITVKKSTVVLFWSAAAGSTRMLSNLYGLNKNLCDLFKSVEHVMQATKLRDATFFHKDSMLGSFESLRAHPYCNTLVGILFPKNKGVINAGGDPFKSDNGIGYWLKKGMDGILAKVATNHKTACKINSAAKKGLLPLEFTTFELVTLRVEGPRRPMDCKELWIKVLMEKFTMDQQVRDVLFATGDKRLIEFVRGGNAANHKWGG
jgi:hypothetical protein